MPVGVGSAFGGISFGSKAIPDGVGSTLGGSSTGSNTIPVGEGGNATRGESFNAWFCACSDWVNDPKVAMARTIPGTAKRSDMFDFCIFFGLEVGAGTLRVTGNFYDT